MADTAPVLPLWREASFAKIWLLGLMAGVMRWLEMLAFGLWALDQTGSPTLVALLVILRFLPLALAGVVMGALSDLVRPERLLRLMLAVTAGVWVVMALLFHADLAGYPLLALATLVSGLLFASDMPVRRRLLGDVVPTKRLAGAMALDSAASNATRMLGPLIGGALYQTLGITGVFAVGAVVYAAAFFLAGRLPAADRPPTATIGLARLAEPFRQIAAAARHALGLNDVRRVLAVTVVFNVFGFPYMTLVPVIARDELGLASATIGVITAIEGLFALTGAVLLARTTRPYHERRLYLGAVAGLLVTITALGLATSALTLALALAVGGLCAAAFAAMQATLIYRIAPPAMRGRFLGLMTICIGAGVLGLANAGLTAELIGASSALVVIAIEGAVLLALVARGWPELRVAETRS